MVSRRRIHENSVVLAVFKATRYQSSPYQRAAKRGAKNHVIIIGMYRIPNF